ncbi:MAG: 4-(cytidine 5'-diphospho)-2-C-methyl-D-erythritol kinase [Actinomycetota bacterium]
MTATARSVTRVAPAKLNVFLRVLGARDDGYHDLESLVLPLSLADEVTVTEAKKLDVIVDAEIELSDGLDAGGMNLSLVAALALAEECAGRIRGAEIRIAKRIPVAAGLGGGSADAAATLLALNELWGCRLDRDALLTIAEQIGSDVPAMLAGGAVMMRGRGERIAPVHVLTTWWVVKPFGFPTRSPDAYRWWDEDGGTVGPDPGVLVAAAETGNVDLLGHALFNDLEGPVSGRHPEIAAVKQAFLDAGALGAVMSGSGPTVVALARHMGQADRLAEAVPGSFVVSGPPAG